eukprot:sb/3472031/
MVTNTIQMCATMVTNTVCHHGNGTTQINSPQISSHAQLVMNVWVGPQRPPQLTVPLEDSVPLGITVLETVTENHVQKLSDTTTPNTDPDDPSAPCVDGYVGGICPAGYYCEVKSQTPVMCAETFYCEKGSSELETHCDPGSSTFGPRFTGPRFTGTPIYREDKFPPIQKINGI